MQRQDVGAFLIFTSFLLFSVYLHIIGRKNHFQVIYHHNNDVFLHFDKILHFRANDARLRS